MNPGEIALQYEMENIRTLTALDCFFRAQTLCGLIRSLPLVTREVSPSGGVNMNTSPIYDKAPKVLSQQLILAICAVLTA
jgi:hypothetical protein